MYLETLFYSIFAEKNHGNIYKPQSPSENIDENNTGKDIYANIHRHTSRLLCKSNEVVDMFDRTSQIGIVNAIKTGINNAKVERLNSAMQELKVIGKGYRNTDNFRIAILSLW
jgi:hypothetical protein